MRVKDLKTRPSTALPGKAPVPVVVQLLAEAQRAVRPREADHPVRTLRETGQGEAWRGVRYNQD
jgi:hypothetical protein